MHEHTNSKNRPEFAVYWTKLWEILKSLPPPRYCYYWDNENNNKQWFLPVSHEIHVSRPILELQMHTIIYFLWKWNKLNTFTSIYVSCSLFKWTNHLKAAHPALWFHRHFLGPETTNRFPLYSFLPNSSNNRHCRCGSTKMKCSHPSVL